MGLGERNGQVRLLIYFNSAFFVDMYVLSFADDVCILFVHCPLFFLWWACDEPLFHSEILGSRLQVTIFVEAVMHSWTSLGYGSDRVSTFSLLF